MSRDYLALIPSANRNQPRFSAVADLITQPFAQQTDLLADGYQYIDLDLAVGAQLDALGDWIGQTRRIPVALGILLFGFDGMSGVDTFGEEGDLTIGASFYEEGAGIATGITVLDDSYYRFLLKAKVVSNQSDGSPGDLLGLLEYLFGVPCLLDDLGDMSMTISIGRALTQTEELMITQLDMLPRPSGVLLTVI